MSEFNILVKTGNWFKVTEDDVIIAKFMYLDDADKFLGHKMAEAKADAKWRQQNDH